MSDRLNVQKTYKLYINGQFPRTESGRYYPVKDSDGKFIANACLASRKDFRNAVQSARSAVGNWNSRTAYNRGQILYRIAETMEYRKDQFIQELLQFGFSQHEAEIEINTSVDKVVYYAGWSDKFQQIFSSVNPVSSSHFNFSILENQGVIAVIAPETNPLCGILSVIIPAIVSGNTVVCLASENYPFSAISLAEVLQTSDVPSGVVNILTGKVSELHEHFASHMDVDGIIYCGQDNTTIQQIKESASLNMKRVKVYNKNNWLEDKTQSPYFILENTEVKTTWHPIGK